MTPDPFCENFLVPVIPTVLGNFCLPMMIGAKDLAFPRINLLSWYLFVIAGAETLIGSAMAALALTVNIATLYAPAGYLPSPSVPPPWQPVPDRPYVPPPARPD